MPAGVMIPFCGPSVATGKMLIGDGVGEGDGDGLGDPFGVGDGEGVDDGVGVGLGVGDGAGRTNSSTDLP